jgi:hypothetical protein
MPKNDHLTIETLKNNADLKNLAEVRRIDETVFDEETAIVFPLPDPVGDERVFEPTMERAPKSRTTETETTFTEDDPRACPRDLEAFRVAVALEIDRLRANKKNYEF